MADNDKDPKVDWVGEEPNPIDGWENVDEHNDHPKEGGEKTFEEQLDEVKDKSRDGVKDAFWVSKEEVLEELARAKNIEQLVNVFAKWTDKYWLEAILSRIPWLGDIGPALVSTCFLFYQWRKIWLWRKEMLKIFLYQAADFILWAIPYIWNVVDFFFKGNVYSARVFKKHVEKLKQLAIQKWATQEEIDSITRTEDETLKKMEEQMAKKRK